MYDYGEGMRHACMFVSMPGITTAAIPGTATKCTYGVAFNTLTICAHPFRARYKSYGYTGLEHDMVR